jgi:hypothetical protein
VQSSTGPSSRYYYVRFQYEPTTTILQKDFLSIIVAGDEVAWIEVQTEAKKM